MRPGARSPLAHPSYATDLIHLQIRVYFFNFKILTNHLKFRNKKLAMLFLYNV